MGDEHYKWRITDGGRDLRSYLTAKKISVPDFCEQHELDRIQVQRALNGERWQRITVDFAYSIERATNGRVKWSRWLSATGVPVVTETKKRTGTEG